MMLPTNTPPHPSSREGAAEMKSDLLRLQRDIESGVAKITARKIAHRRP